MRYRHVFLSLVIFFFILGSFGLAMEYPLQFFLAKASSRVNELSKKEKMELLNQIEEVLGQAQRVHTKLIQNIQTGEGRTFLCEDLRACKGL